MNSLRPHILAGLVSLAAPVAFAQGVPTFDAGMFLQRERVLQQGEQDLALQRDRLTKEEELEAIEQEQLQALEDILNATTLTSGSSGALVASLEAGSSPESAAETLYDPVDPNLGAAQLFGDASGSIEQLIIRAAQETHHMSGVGTAGLSPKQWRCLLQALIWQESRFTIGARSPVGAFGLTQIMPGTAQDLGIYPAYYENPYIQVTGGARYLAQMLAMFDGNIIHGLAAYNAGPGNVQRYSGVPPFAETQHYVQVIPERYNLYLARVGGVDALGTIDPVLLANSTMSLTSFGAGVYGDYSLVSVQAAALRVQDIITRIGETDDIHAAMSLNTYARAELARLIAIRTRLKAAHTRPLSSAELAMAAAQAREQDFMQFDLEAFR
ncbi:MULTISPECIES: lytic transglycosylase domain-containing protein [Pacificibacter]|uniref:lytic transglycosylase domain-containing protein n=1 Tax=Pacificibacter TaxID=1042323 RepID=UPI001C090961|nr:MULTISPECIES: lytic transglycosylase domain-containing protein [Pacificibacter]MBU2934507.1 lytic transglycosylase domain-containing protein [Pacificibacter marinus]MDO6617126.1 lytic transglycosylase domain-containing protein [Pacificibacter sp. 1_MG-2023]